MPVTIMERNGRLVVQGVTENKTAKLITPDIVNVSVPCLQGNVSAAWPETNFHP